MISQRVKIDLNCVKIDLNCVSIIIAKQSVMSQYHYDDIYEYYCCVKHGETMGAETKPLSSSMVLSMSLLYGLLDLLYDSLLWLCGLVL